MPEIDRHARHRIARAASGFGLFATIAVAGSMILVSQSSAEEDTITVDQAVTPELAEVDTGQRVETFLLVGSDSRENANPDAADFGSIGDANTTTGRRSDTIMVLRHDKETGEAALLSLPRDLWVKVPGFEGKSRINAAYSRGTDVLVRTIKTEIGISVNHYVEVDFEGFKALVDAVNGVEACFFFPTRDRNTGLSVEREGCHVLSGVQALQYTRSRYFEEFRDGDWREDDRYDLGRIARQQEFILNAVQRAEESLAENPFMLNRLVDASRMALVVSEDVDLFSLAHRFRDLEPKNLLLYSLPIDFKTVNGNDVLTMNTAKSKSIIDYFNGLESVAPDPTQFD